MEQDWGSSPRRELWRGWVSPNLPKFPMRWGPPAPTQKIFFATLSFCYDSSLMLLTFILCESSILMSFMIFTSRSQLIGKLILSLIHSFFYTRTSFIRRLGSISRKIKKILRRSRLDFGKFWEYWGWNVCLLHKIKNI